MQAPRESADDEVTRLRGCLRDLVSLTTMPALTAGAEPAQIVSTLLHTLFGLLNLDFACARLFDPDGGPVIEMLQVGPALDRLAQAPELAEVLQASLGHDPLEWPPSAPVLIGDVPVFVAVARLGVEGELGVVVAGSLRRDFSAETDRLLLHVAANQAALALQQRRILSQSERNAIAPAEDTVKAGEDELKTIIDTIPALAWRTRPDGSADFFNRHYLDFVGLTAEQASGWGWTSAVHPDDLSSLAAIWQHCLASGESGESEARLRRYDGDYRWLLFRANPLRNQQGEIVNWYGINTDIEDRRRAEQEQTALLDLTYDSVFSRALDDTITFWNRGAEDLYGWTRQEAIGMRAHELLKTTFPVPREQIDGELLRTGHWEGELLTTRRDARQIVVASRWSLQKEKHGQPAAILETNNDITERKRTQESLREAQANLARVNRVMLVGEMTASIAHEISQPLTGVVANAGTSLRWLAAQPPNLEEARAYLELIIKDSNRAKEIIGRIRGLVGKVPPHVQRTDLNEAITEVIALVASELHKNRVAVQTDLSESLPLIAADRVQLQQLMLNLIANANEAMTSTTQRTRDLAIVTGAQDSAEVFVEVRDSGPGFDLNSIDRLFDSFYTTKTTGTGMGLSISRSIVEAHGGRIEAWSNVPVGAVFRVTLPVDGPVVA